jgi:hypothetical protein
VAVRGNEHHHDMASRWQPRATYVDRIRATVRQEEGDSADEEYDTEEAIKMAGAITREGKNSIRH